MWFRVFQSQAMMYKCNDLLLFDHEAPPQYYPGIVASDDEHDPVAGYAYCQRRLACLLRAWTDKDVDWQGFLRISQTNPLLGTKIRNIVILTYQIITSSGIILHGKRLRAPQEEGQKTRGWWKHVLIAA